MIVYVGAGSGPLRDVLTDAGHGQMVSRQTGAFRIPKRGRWAFDNGAWTDFLHGKPFGEEQYLHRLAQIKAAPRERWPDWCVCPDVVSYWMSLEYSASWKRWLNRQESPFRWYLALQDYVKPEDVELVIQDVGFDGLFIGGSTKWKLTNSAAWVKWGHEHDMPVHIARVNGPARLQWSINVDADSVDGTGWVRAGQKWLPYLLSLPKKERLLFRIPPEFMDEGRREYEEAVGQELEWGEESAWQEMAEALAELGPEDFSEWLSEAYGIRVSPDQAPTDQKEFSAWKVAIVNEFQKGVDPRFWKKIPLRK